MRDITVLFFSYAADRMNGRSRRYSVEDGTTIETFFYDTLAAALGDAIEQFRFSVNAVWAQPSTVLANGDEVAVIPPVSGG